MKKLFATKLDPSLQGKEYTINRRKVIVEDAIAEGGFSIVFLVFCEIENTKYALKRMYVNSKDNLNLCIQEINISVKVSGHKNMVKLIDTAINQLGNGINEVLILMHYYPGSVLSEMNQKVGVGFAEEDVLKIFRDVCEAVALIHACDPPIIHRDIKVENILKDSSGNYILCDFGSATMSTLDPQVQGVNALNEELQKFTTPAYRSPEMVDLYSNKPITTKSDIWALGCLLYRLCFFTNCFGDSTLAISGGNFTVPDHHGYSTDLLRLIKYMLEVDPDTRPDIFQVAHVAFKISNRRCPVVNKNNVHTVNISTLPIPQTESQAKLAKPSGIGRVNDPSDQVQGTSINPRERPRGQLANRPQGFNLNTHAPSNQLASSAANQVPASKVEVTPLSTNPFDQPPSTLSSNHLISLDFEDQSGAKHSSLASHDNNGKSLMDFCNPQFEDNFTSNMPINVPLQPPVPQAPPTFWSRPPHPPGHYRTLSNCQSSYSMTPPFVGQPMMPLQRTQVWNPFQNPGIGIPQGNANVPMFTPRYLTSHDPSTGWQNPSNRHRRNMSDTSGLVTTVQSKHHNLQVNSQTVENLNTNSARSMWNSNNIRPQQNLPQYSSARQLQQTPSDNLFQQFGDLTLRHSHSTAPLFSLDQSASTSSLPSKSHAVQNYSSTRSLAAADELANVDAFGAVPFHNMVSQFKRKHEMGHKRSISEL